MFPPFCSPFPTLCPSHPSRFSQNTGFGFPASCSKLPLAALHMVMCMFQCYSLKSSHPFLLPLYPKVCSLCLCLLCSVKTRRDGVRRDFGGGFRREVTHVCLWPIHVVTWQRPLQYCKVIILQLIN